NKLAERLADIENQPQNPEAALIAPRTPNIPAAPSNPPPAELKAWQVVQSKCALLVANYQFEEARALIGNIVLTDAGLLQEKSALLKKAGWLIDFKNFLIIDI